MPFIWEVELQNLLPPTAKVLLENQQRKFQKDWATVSTAFPQLAQDLFLHSWLIVNTRTFYWTAPGIKKTPPRDDCMALNPFDDYFNHADRGCVVEYSPEGFTVVTDRAYEKNDEIFISYGNHGNDFLLAEYGFIMSENKWDEVHLDKFLLPRLSARQVEHLEEADFLGNYVLDENIICHRTQVALRIICLPLKTWSRFVSGQDDGENDQPSVDKVLSQILENYQQYAREILDRILRLTVGLPGHQQTLTKRWRQIQALLQCAIKKYKMVNNLWENQLSYI